MGEQGVIYKIENLVNGKVYIGQTKQNFERRLKDHLWMLRNGKHDNKHLQNAWNKYGSNNFGFSVVEKCDIEKLDEAERFWIAYYKALKGVYNLESGGTKNKEIHESTRSKMSEITKSHGWVGGKHPNAKKVVCIDTGVIYPSIVEASEDIGCNYDNIHQVCLGNNVCAKGKDGKYYQFAYYEEGKSYELKQIRNIKIPKKVICVNTGEIFNSTREAAEKTGVQQSHISQCCNGKRNFAGQMPNGDYRVWEFLANFDLNKKYTFEKRGKFSNRKRKVKCLTTGEIFDTIAEAAEKYGLNGSNITSACKGRYKSAGKLPDGTPLRWSYVD